MPRPVRKAPDETQATPLLHAVTIEVTRGKPPKKRLEARDMIVDGAPKTAPGYSIGTRAMLLLALGSASWVACLMTVSLAKRVIA